MKLPTLYTERLMIRPLSVLDADDMYEYAKTPLVGPMAGWPPHTSLSDTINVIKIMSTIKTPYELGAWAIVLKSNQKMILLLLRPQLRSHFPNSLDLMNNQVLL